MRLLTTGADRSGLLRAIRPLANRWELRHDLAKGRLPTLRRAKTRVLHILSFHRVGPDGDGFLDPLATETFHRQMRALARTSTVLPLDQAVDRLRANELPDNAVSITFDDGYRDNLVHAFPVLRSLGLPATIFLTTGSIGTDRLLWHDRVFRGFARTNVPRIERFWSDGGVAALAERPAALGVRADVLRYLKSLDPEQREEQISVLLDRLEVDDVRTCLGLMLDWDDVRELHRGGLAFGGHTVRHPVLTRIPPDVARWEIETSKVEIEREIDAPVRSFAYPNGGSADFDRSTKEILERAGYDHAVTTVFGTNGIDGAVDVDPFELRRIGTSGWTSSELVARLDLYRVLRESA